MPIEIRAATPEDAGTISALNADVQQIHADAHPWRFKPPGLHTFTEKDARDLLSKPGYFAFLAFDEGGPNGYLVAEIVRRSETARHFAHELIYIHEMSVPPVARRKGVGTSLLNGAKAHARSLGISLVALDTWSFNEGALLFFQKNGLVPFNVRLWNKGERPSRQSLRGFVSANGREPSIAPCNEYTT
jgi:GNAT superfamily N-acetyltransferase